MSFALCLSLTFSLSRYLSRDLSRLCNPSPPLLSPRPRPSVRLFLLSSLLFLLYVCLVWNMPVSSYVPAYLFLLFSCLPPSFPRCTSELRMLKAVVDEHGSSALRLKDAYVNNPKRMEQLLDTFPMSSVLKKVPNAEPWWHWSPVVGISHMESDCSRIV